MVKSASIAYRLFLLLLVALGIGLLLFILATGELQTKVEPFLALKGEIFVNLPGKPFATINFFQVFQFVFATCLLIILGCALIILVRPIRSDILVQFASGIVCAAWCAGLYFIFFDLAWTNNYVIQHLSLFLATGLLGISSYNFTRAFSAYPVPFSEARRRAYYARIVSTRGSISLSRRTVLGRFRRALLYRQRRSEKRDFERTLKGDKLPFYRDHYFFLENPRISAGVLTGGLVLFWMNELYFQIGDALGLAALLLAGIGLAPAFFVIEKLKIDLELIDSDVRRKVLWIYAGLYIPLLVGISLVAIASFFMSFYPPVTGIVLAAAFFFLPPAWFTTFVVCLMISILFFGAIDPERTIKSSTLYAILGLILTVAFVFAEQIITPLIVNYTRLPGMVGALAAGSIVAVAFGPLRQRVDKMIEKVVKKTLGSNADTQHS